ncbi:hypothetical protein Bca52824_054356 [Brassica carinata]|uniref:Uncharacterized protein n=1 Tax=Brassica carinata TaxID=52824 RepID=A0A8X7R783_BRACI|nr:hypothetical protein Bca52824_054356 [Brassica carinata]
MGARFRNAGGVVWSTSHSLPVGGAFGVDSAQLRHRSTLVVSGRDHQGSGGVMVNLWRKAVVTPVTSYMEDSVSPPRRHHTTM